MGNQLARSNGNAQVAEQVIIGGDLAALSAEQRVQYYHAVCNSVGLNPFTKPFEFIRLNGKLTLYAKRDAADQLRTLHGISLSIVSIEYTDDMMIVTVKAADKAHRQDTDLGVVSLKGLSGEAKANAMLKCITKAKRRVTLSIAGLGWLDETEIDSIPSAQPVDVDIATGEILDGTPTVDTMYDTIKKWKNRTEAEMWAVRYGSCENEYEARNSLEKIIKAHGGTVTKANYMQIYTDFYKRCMDKLEQQADVQAEVRRRMDEKIDVVFDKPEQEELIPA